MPLDPLWFIILSFSPKKKCKLENVDYLHLEGVPESYHDSVELHIETIAVTSIPRNKASLARPVVPPISVATTYEIDKCEDFAEAIKNEYVYSRFGNHTCQVVAEVINKLEGGIGGLVFSSGMAAITTSLLANLDAGDHLIAPDPVYSGTHKYLEQMLPHHGVEISWVTAGCHVDEYRKLVKKNTKVLYAETPANPTMAVTDMEEFGRLGNSLPGVMTMVDATFASPYLLQPLKYDVDISIHSCTKYLGGHSDVLAGFVSTRRLELFEKLSSYQKSMGSTLSPFDAYLLLRGVRTLHVRMDRHSSNALRIAQYLEQHPKILKVYYPGLPSHPQHEIAKKQMKLFGGMVSFELKGGLQAGKTFVESLRIPHLAVSLGGVESLIEHPASMTHGKALLGEEAFKQSTVPLGLVRF
uniref:Cystathionine gamma-lyase-like n=1 Tax=Saccoglossus kowalevskii TaxID=10224 RepID=A0ABM0M9D7_SACKO